MLMKPACPRLSRPVNPTSSVTYTASATGPGGTTTDAALMKDKVRVVQVVATPTPVVYPIALVHREGRSASAPEFLKYVLSDADGPCCGATDSAARDGCVGA